MVPELHKLMHRLQQKFARINDGGCCVVASAVAQNLRDKNVPVKILVLQRDGRSDSKVPGSVVIARKLGQQRNNRKHLLTADEWPLNFNHIVVKMKWRGRQYIIDTDFGCIASAAYLKRARYAALTGQMTQREADTIANNEEGWNPMFDRDQIPRMCDIIEASIQQI